MHLKRILIVDDEKDIRDTLSYLLKSYGYFVDVASCGSTALASLKLNQYDSIISDIQMPNCSGVELVRTIRLAGSSIPIFLMTGSNFSRIEALNIRANDLFKKPFEINSIINYLDVFYHR